MRGPTVVILGASGLIGYSLALDLLRKEIPVVAIARHFTLAQRQGLGASAIVSSVVDLGREALWHLLGGAQAKIIVNCIGVLQDSPYTNIDVIHREFVEKLAAFCASEPKRLLVHLSVPGEESDDPTPFSRSKHDGERIIASSGAPYIILRPGFVIAPAVYGGSALMRALAVLPVSLPPRYIQARFAVTGVGDLCATVEHAVSQWQNGRRVWAEKWDVMEQQPSRTIDVIDAFRKHFGAPPARIPLPAWLVQAAGTIGDSLAWLGWRPPLRSTAMLELRRGVVGDPTQWIRETGVKPVPLETALMRLPVTIQEKWFARLYLLKPFALGVLAIFWIASGLIPVTLSFDAATAVLTVHGFSVGHAHTVVLAGCLADIAVGFSIAFRRSCRAGLIAGIAASITYLIAGTVISPELWLAPLGELTKIVPVIALMLICLALIDDR